MKKNKNEEVMKDDEVLRIQSFTDGNKVVSRWEFRPVTALTISWMQRNSIFTDKHDLIWKSSAFAFLHSAPFSEIRKCVNDESDFIDAVDCWIEKNLKHHSEIEEIGKSMNEAFAMYMASTSVLSSNDSGSGSGSGN